MGSGSSGQQAQTITPGESAQAAVGTAGAGELMSIANQPIEQYSNLATTEALGPAETQTQQALANQAAMQSASAQQAIQSQVDPQAYAQRQMRMQAANQRLGQLYSTDPTAFSYNAPGAFTVPGTTSVPTPEQLRQNAAAIASNLSVANVNSKGMNPQLQTLANMQSTIPNPTSPATYY